MIKKLVWVLENWNSFVYFGKFFGLKDLLIDWQNNIRLIDNKILVADLVQYVVSDGNRYAC